MAASGLAHLLMQEKIISKSDYLTIKKMCGFEPFAFAKGILALGILEDDTLASFIAERTHYERVDHSKLIDLVDFESISKLDTFIFTQLEVLPLEVKENYIHVVMADPLDKAVIKQLEFFTNKKLKIFIAPLNQIQLTLQKLFPNYKPQPTHFETFLTNYAESATKRRYFLDLQNKKVQDLMDGDDDIKKALLSALKEQEVEEEISLDISVEDIPQDKTLNLSDLPPLSGDENTFKTGITPTLSESSAENKNIEHDNIKNIDIDHQYEHTSADNTNNITTNISTNTQNETTNSSQIESKTETNQYIEFQPIDEQVPEQNATLTTTSTEDHLIIQQENQIINTKEPTTQAQDNQNIENTLQIDKFSQINEENIQSENNNQQFANELKDPLEQASNDDIQQMKEEDSQYNEDINIKFTNELSSKEISFIQNKDVNIEKNQTPKKNTNAHKTEYDSTKLENEISSNSTNDILLQNENIIEQQLNDNNATQWNETIANTYDNSVELKKNPDIAIKDLNVSNISEDISISDSNNQTNLDVDLLEKLDEGILQQDENEKLNNTNNIASKEITLSTEPPEINELNVSNALDKIKKEEYLSKKTTSYTLTVQSTALFTTAKLNQALLYIKFKNKRQELLKEIATQLSSVINYGLIIHITKEALLPLLSWYCHKPKEFNYLKLENEISFNEESIKKLIPKLSNTIQKVDESLSFIETQNNSIVCATIIQEKFICILSLNSQTFDNNVSVKNINEFLKISLSKLL